MALPFIAGLAVGAGVALLFTKREAIKESFKSDEIGANLQKGFNESLNKGKEVSNKALQYVQSGLEKTAQTLKERLDSKQEESLKTNHRSPTTQATKSRKTTQVRQDSKPKRIKNDF